MKGQPARFISGHNRRLSAEPDWYVRRSTRKGAVLEHVLVAEKALGKPLPAGAEVHHVDENKRNNSNSNLVVCQDHGYHFLLHVRARVVRAGGNPNTQRICCTCHLLKLFAEFNRSSASKSGGLHGACRECQRVYWQEWRARRAAEASQKRKAS